MHQLTIAIIGSGSRGIDAYANLMSKDPVYKLVAFCDIRQVRLDLAKERFHIKDNMLFKNENDFFKKKLADVCIIATQDQDHVRHALKAMKLGYDILLEKPITPKLNECYKLLEAQRKYKKKVIVCHVLRYAPAYLETAYLIGKGTIGKLLDIQALEQVAYWHQAHSFVRGNWRKTAETSPMILAKCCHDMDLLQFFARSRCKCIASMGSLDYFKKKNKPKGASDYCKTCKYIDSCPYSTKNLYIKRWKELGSPKDAWPFNVVCTDYPLTEAKLKKAYESNDYGRCVFSCDNDVVDHQQTIITFENGVTASLCMTAFTGTGGRVYKFHGSIGEIDLDEENQKLFIKQYGKKEEIIPFSDIVTHRDVVGHSGGDEGLVDALYTVITGNNKKKDMPATSLAASIESHLMAFAAEESRLNNGKLVYIKHK